MISEGSVMFFFRKKKQCVLWQACVNGQSFGAVVERLIGTLPAKEAEAASYVAALSKVLPLICEKPADVALHAFLKERAVPVFLATYGAALVLTCGAKAFLPLKSVLTRRDFALTVKMLSHLRALRFTGNQTESVFFAILKTILPLVSSSLWRAQAVFLLSCASTSRCEFSLAQERLFLKTRAVTAPAFQEAVKTLTDVLLVSPVRRVKFAKSGFPYEAMLEIYPPLKNSLLAIFASRNEDLFPHEKLFVQEEGTARAKMLLKIGNCAFRIPASIDSVRTSALAELLAKTLTLASSTPRERSFYYVDTRRINRPDSTPHAGPVALFIPLKALTEAGLDDKEFLQELADHFCIYSGSQALADGLVLRHRVRTSTDKSAPYETEPISGILFINHARNRSACATADITRLLRMEHQKLVKEGIVPMQTSVGRLAAAKNALDRALTQSYRSLT